MYIILAIIYLVPYAICLRSRAIPKSMDRMLHAGRYAYDKHATTDANGPTIVNISMYIEGMSSFRTQTMDFQLDVYFQQYWKDSRLAHNESGVSMVVMCMMNLAKWPLDEQRCNLRILSYAYEIDQLKIQWFGDDAITRNPGITMSDMQIVDLSPGLCDGNYTLGVWSCVTAEFYVKREMTHHFIQSYVPTTLIVVISWFSFWLDVESVPARVSLAITTLLTLSTQANAARMALPEVSYMKAIDVWMGVCMMFVFGVMIEFTIVNYAQRQAYAKADRKLAKSEAVANNNAQASENGEAKQSTPPPPTIPKSPLRQRAKQLVNKAFRSSELQLADLQESDGKRVTAHGLQQIPYIDSMDGDSYENHISNYIIENLLYSPKARQLTVNEYETRTTRSPVLRKERSKTVKVRKMLGWDDDDNSTPLDWTAINSHSTSAKRINWSKRWGLDPGGNVRFGLQLSNTVRRIKEMQKSRKLAARRGAKKIDQYSRWVFPATYFMFCFSYWTYYLWIA